MAARARRADDRRRGTLHAPKVAEFNTGWAAGRSQDVLARAFAHAAKCPDCGDPVTHHRTHGSS